MQQPPMKINQPESVNVNLTLVEVDVVLQSMGRREYDLVADLIAKIRSQVIKQIDEFNHRSEGLGA